MNTDSEFDEIIERRGTHSAKWDTMEQIYGVPATDGIAMWIADMDFRAPACVRRALADMCEHGVFGYFGDERDYRAAIGWWMQKRHGWTIEPDWIFSTHGLVNGAALCVDTWTRPGDGVVLMTPVYHSFARIIRAAGRKVVECPLAREGDRYVLDIPAWDARMTGNERLLILCSPHNPGGRVWTAEELAEVAAFARRHDLLVVSDEIHHDLVFPGHRHNPMATTCPEILDRLVMMTSATKTFNIAGAHTGNVIIPDPALRRDFASRLAALGLSPNSFGLHMATAAYSPEGADWVDRLMRYLAVNQQVFNEGVAAIPGVRPMPLEATYLAWVDFSGTGMAPEDFTRRVEKDARIAASHGDTFGTGGETFLRFNIATPRARLEEAVRRLQGAFADLQ